MNYLMQIMYYFYIIYKDIIIIKLYKDTTEYKFDLIKYDLSLFYDYNKEKIICYFLTKYEKFKYFLRTILFSELFPIIKCNFTIKRQYN